jgi:ABC-type uncharacterized transport system substrate-binding protein
MRGLSRLLSSILSIGLVFLVLVVIAAGAQVGIAQPAQKMSRVGYVWAGSLGSDTGTLAGLQQGLADLGYVEGKTLILERRYADGSPERLASIIAELAASKVDVLVTPGTPTTRAAQRIASGIPIVSVSGDPVASGFAASLARPGGPITGLSLYSGESVTEKWLEVLKEAMPKLARIGMIWNSDNPNTARQMERVRVTGARLGIDAVFASMRQPDDARRRLESLIVPDDPFLQSQQDRTIVFAREHRLPAIYGLSAFVEAGGLMSYSASIFDVWRRGASYIDRILKGTRPSDLPIEQPTKFTLRINLETAKALGLEVPPSLLARADVILPP